MSDKQPETNTSPVDAKNPAPAEEEDDELSPLDKLHNAVLQGTFVEMAKGGAIFAIDENQKALVPSYEFGVEKPKPGARVELLVERPVKGFWAASIRKAEALRRWDELRALAAQQAVIEVPIIAANDGGLVADLGVRGFIPRSQVDLHRVDELQSFVNQTLQVRVIKFDERDGALILSRRALLEERKEELQAEALKSITVGEVYEGTVRRVMPYGAFVDIGGVEGLLHRSNLSWGRETPQDLLKPGDVVSVKVLDFDEKNKKLALGRKQLLDDPWKELAARFELGSVATGTVVSLAAFGAFVELEAGVEGLVHNTEMSWTERINHPKQVVKKGESVQVKILGVDTEERRLRLSIKQLQTNPWNELAERVKAGDVLTVKVARIADFGVFCELAPGLDGLLHANDISWSERVSKLAERFEIGSELQVRLLELDVEAGRASLGLKQLEEDPWETAARTAKVGTVLEVEVARIADFGAFVKITDKVDGLIHISELSEERVERVGDKLEVGQKLEAMVLSFDRAKRRIGLTIRADHMAAPPEPEPEEALAQEPEADPRATLGDILPESLKKKAKKS
ncbi:MAG: 30S ribosomal protein S1 [Myxococcota bacterium]|jgi:small subunit ribosomal protein S1|nr:30S ribosomal protein S1 [Myxococcota bacterium]